MSEDQKQTSAPAPSGGQRREGGPGAGRREGGPGGPGGRPRGKRQYFRKKKVCKFCVEKMDFIDYKRADILSQFVQERGKILPRRMTGVCARGHQARAQYCFAALFGQRGEYAGPARGDPGGATWRACAGRGASCAGTGRGSAPGVTNSFFQWQRKTKHFF